MIMISGKKLLRPIEENSSTTIPLGTLGLTSDAEIFRQLRYNEANINVSSKTAASEILVQVLQHELAYYEKEAHSYSAVDALVGMIALLSFLFSRGRNSCRRGFIWNNNRTF